MLLCTQCVTQHFLASSDFLSFSLFYSLPIFLLPTLSKWSGCNLSKPTQSLVFGFHAYPTYNVYTLYNPPSVFIHQLLLFFFYLRQKWIKDRYKINVLSQTHNVFGEMQFLLKLKLFKVYKAGGASCMPLKKQRG